MICSRCKKDKSEADYYKTHKQCKDCIKEMKAVRYKHQAERDGRTPQQQRRKNSIKQVEAAGFVVISEVKMGSKRLLQVQCPYCDNTITTQRHKLITGHTKSCGCTKIAKRKGGEYISGTFMQHFRQAAEVRGYEIAVTVEDLEHMLERQNFKCALTGWDLECGYVDMKEYTLSVDRIDSSKDYYLDNIQIVHKMVNMCKQSYSQDEFIKMCKAIAERN